MRRATSTLIATLLLAALLAPAGHAKTAAELLREGLYAEEVEGNLDAAVGIYQQISADSTAPRNLVAQALYRQGMCYMKKKNEADARVAFQKLVTDYSDQTELVGKVKPMLEELSNADPATLMPPDTILYLELGSPGRQVETILNMLKDTPLENPLLAVSGRAKENAQGGARNQPTSTPGTQAAGSNKGPQQILNALLNPSMVAEFKKIRGIGIGVQGLNQEHPPALVVLFPGRSDALRGLITMAVGMVGQPVQATEGMQMVSFPDSAGGAAYDDNVVIIATGGAKAAEQLQWAVKQYKGRTHEPSLASANKSFTRISKQARQQNALTFWMNVGETYRLLPTVMNPILPQVQMADGLVDFKNIDDLYASLSLRETGIAVEATVNFKAGYQSVAYSMIHTPNLDKAALKVVPPEAVALLTMTLGEAGTAQAQAASDKLQSMTGLDLGNQIFGNIQQLTLFAVPPREALLPESGELPPVVRSIGLAVNSKEPQRTQQLLLSLLQAAQLLPQDTQTAELIPAVGRYEIALAHNMKLFGYTDEPSKTMLLSLNAQVVETSTNSMRQNRSVLTGGSLQDALATLSPTTSKLALLDVGGALQLASQHMHLSSGEAAQQARQSLDELIKATQKTTLRLQTCEEANSFGVRLSLSDLPPGRQIFGPIMQLAQMVSQAKAQVRSAQAKAEAALTILPAGRPPAIDGNVDEVWAGVPSHALNHAVYSPASSEADLSAGFKTMYDNQALYLLVEVTDDRLLSDSAESWLDDGVELFLDADNSKSDVYGDNDYQYHFDWDNTAPAVGESHHNKTNGIQYAFARTETGYRLEAKLPWSTLGTAPTVGKRIGLDVHANDDDDGGDRDTKILWYGQRDVAWQQPKAFGTGELAGLIGWWKLDEAEGTQAADSSGNRHNATVHGNPQWQPAGGKVGGALALDGNGDYLEVADESAFDATAGVTVAAWIKLNAFDKPWQAIVTKGEDAWRIQRNNETNTLEFACTGVHVPDNSRYGSLFGTKALTPGEWHHIAGTYDGRKMCLYLDGALDASQEAWGPIGTDDNPVLLGENGQVTNRFFNGLLDNVRIYNFGLAEADVQQLYQEKQ